MDVISLHVPKTAGCTFRSRLFKIYGEAQTRLDYDDAPMNPTMRYNVDHEGWRASADEEIRAIDPGIRAIHGHFAIEKYEGVFPEAPRITWLRHPASWLISLYHFWKNIPPVSNPPSHPLVYRIHIDGITFREFIEDPIARNQVSRYYIGTKSLESFAFVGIQEHFDTDVEHLAQLLGWPEIEVESLNRSPDPNYKDRKGELIADDRLIDRILSLNERDMALYEEAVKLRARRLERSKARAEKHARLVALRDARARRGDELEVA
jgi:Sulfotransferase family